MMSPENIVKYIHEHFKEDTSCIQIKVIDDVDTIRKEYPLAHAVTRASLAGKKKGNKNKLWQYITCWFFVY